MARKKQTGPKPVEAITHGEKRTNIPTADAHDLVTPEVEERKTVTYPRDIKSPQLVWRGKEELDQTDLEVDAPPIYIQEKIDPRVIVENLRETASVNELEPEMTLFETFDGLDEMELVEFYKHSSNWSNRMILGDSLQVMASLAERERLRGKVQMIYLDPPYGIKFGSNWQVSARRRAVTDGRIEDVARESEQIRAFRDTWALGTNSYLTYLRDRITAARDLLNDSGSLFMQISVDNVHLVRAVLDEVFGYENMIAQIGFAKTAGLESDYLATVNDYLLWFGKDRDKTKFRRLYLDKYVGGPGASQYTNVQEIDGTTRALSTAEKVDQRLLPEGARVFSHQSAYTAGSAQTTLFDFEFEGRTFKLPPGQRWRSTRAGMSRMAVANRLMVIGNSLRYKRFLDDFPVYPLTDNWSDTAVSGFGDPKFYVVQTNTKVVQRCVLMTTDPGDLVLDPTCGSGTTAYVAEQWGRRWITVDSSRVALALARQRLMGSRFPFYLLSDSPQGRKKESQLSARPLPPADPTNDIRHGFVYERVPHITLKAIANNPDIQEGMSREQIDAAIARHADFEVLYDKPYEDKRKARVAGPFTVESLSPHRNLAGVWRDESASEQQAAADPDAQTFEQSILENLSTAGIQNGKKQERLEFDMVEPYASPHIQAVGTRENAEDGTPKKVGICIGPQYGTVSPGFVKDAAREASKTDELDLLCILGFAFDPQVLNADEDYVASNEGFDVAGSRSLGRVPVLLVRMNSDLLIGELKETSGANLFTVFGEPDITIKEDGGRMVVELLGVDVYDPTKDEVRSGGTDQVALWMIDTDYDGESFFVRHCYFTGGQDPYKKLKRELRAEIDEDTWDSLYGTVSRPFPKPSTGKIAVKVINDYGDEVVKVYEV